MNGDQLGLLEKARESLAAARLLLANAYAGIAASRAYYAMFYVAQAFLAGEGMSFSKHSAVIAAFGKHFAKTGRAPARFHQFLQDAQDMRLDSDYGPFHKISAEAAGEQITRAEEFLVFAEQCIRPISPPGESAP